MNKPKDKKQTVEDILNMIPPEIKTAVDRSVVTDIQFKIFKQYLLLSFLFVDLIIILGSVLARFQINDFVAFLNLFVILLFLVIT